MTNYFQKMKAFLPVLFIIVVSSCNQDDKDTKPANADSTEAKMDNTAQPSPTDTAKKNGNIAQTKGDFIDLKAPCAELIELFNKGKFVKFRFIRYQRDENDDVRLFCYALKADVRDDSDDTKFRFGNPVFISKDGRGEDPTTLEGAIITNPALALSREEVETIFLKTDPTSCINLDFVHQKFRDSTGEYDSYQVFKVGTDTKIHLNPSPPSKKQEKFVNKK